MPGQLINGFINVDTAESAGVCLSTKCGELRTKKENRRFEVYNNFAENIFCTVIINDELEKEKVNPGKSKEIVFDSSPTEIRLYFGLPFEEPQYSYTSAWGENYGGNPHVIGLFYAVHSTFVPDNAG